MALNFPTFQANLISDLQNGGFDSLEDFANGIVMRYRELIVNGADPISNNTVIVDSVKLDLLEQGLISAFNASFNENVRNSTIFTSTLAPVIPTVWSGVQLQVALPPPGSVQTVSNSVVNPGTATPIPMPSATNNPQPFVQMLTIFFQTHLGTISGVVNHLITTPSGLVTGTPIPWTGIV